MNEVWILQPIIEHFRLPVFDKLVERGRGRYELQVFGPLVDGEAKRGGVRPYFREFPFKTRKVVGVNLMHWPEIEREIQRHRPAVVVANTHLRILNSWGLPRHCRKVGGAAVAWGKIHSFSQFPPWLLWPAKRVLYPRYDWAIVYGQSAYEELTGVGMPPDRIRIAKNTIDTERVFSQAGDYVERARALRARHGLEEATILLCVARFDPEKRQSDLLDAWPSLRELRPDLHLVLVGSGPFWEQLRARAEALDPERIHLIGKVPDGEDYVWIAAADATLQPGAVGLAINQSMAFGKPTIIADEEGSDTEILEHGRTGWRYPQGDGAALVAVVREIFANPDATHTITERARARMRDDVNIESMVNVIDRCIGDALSLSGQRRGQS